MGLLYLGTPLSWDQAKPHADAIREHGITQFLNIWHRLKDRQGDELLWGDEVEYMVVSFDHDAGAARLSLRQTDILAKLAQLVNDICIESSAKLTDMPTFHPEYGRFMLESTPGSPYTGSLPDLLSVEKSMRYRRTLARSHLKPNEVPITLPVFPRLGVPGVFTDPYYDPANAKASHSLFLPDEITNPHVRFPTITANTRERRGSKVAMNLPLFFDTNTPRPFIDPTIPWDRNIYKEDPEAKNGAALPDHIYMDAMGFGMGCSCLQITFQACNIAEARRVYDALVPIGPIMLALTAASPAWRGYLSDVDCRWNVIAGSVDDRTEEERGIKPLSENKYVIPKSRYDSVDSYISTDWINRPEYNDNPLPIDEKTYQRLRDNGLDDLLAKHIAHLFIRDPLIVFSETLDWNDETSSDHFEGIQSTNWQTLRFKPPPAGSPIGWRVEFRSMEISLTDFENAAFSIFIVLLSRAILSFGLNFYVPMSKVDANMQRAQKRNAAREGTFFFRNSVFPVGSERRYTTTAPVTPPDLPNGCGPSINKENKLRNCYPEVPPPADPEKLRVPIEEEYEEMTIDEIINGKGNDFPGLLGLVHAYLNSLDVDFPIKRKLRKYLALIEQRADGTLMTAATWQREFIRSHPDYKFDSVVSESINYDLLKAADEIERGLRPAPGFLPSHYTGTEEDTGEPGP